MNCPKCSSPLKSTDTFCSKCGTPVNQVQPSQTTPASGVSSNPVSPVASPNPGEAIPNQKIPPVPNPPLPPINPTQNPTAPPKAPVPGVVDPIPSVPSPVPALNQQTPLPPVSNPQQQVPTVQGNINDANTTKVKEPILAAVLNWFLLGAGYVYVGRWKKALLVWGVYIGGLFVLNLIADIMAESEVINLDLSPNLRILLGIPLAVVIQIYAAYDAYKLAKKTKPNSN